METKRNKSSQTTKSTCKNVKDLEQYPGVAINCADDNAVNPSLVKERTRSLNNNPRNDEM